MEYKEHIVEWTDEKVNHFWNFLNNYEPYEGVWFSRQVGDAIVKLSQKYLKIKSRAEALDYGVGKGHLSEYLLKKNNHLTVCDFSLEAVTDINKRFKHYPNFQKAILIRQLPSELESKKFDIVFLVEAVEHLTDSYIDTTLVEIKRVLKPNGIVMITTPNEENLSLSNVCCPECGAIFHRVQHVRCFNRESLLSLIKPHGFIPLFCQSVNLEDYKKINFERLIRFLYRRIFRNSAKKPHLVYIGQNNV